MGRRFQTGGAASSTKIACGGGVGDAGHGRDGECDDVGVMVMNVIRVVDVMQLWV